ncbi:MAG TPA: FAD-binding protein, partial [Nocardioides sp.]|nr:FAD-binding protein [Nocardioides sp.]
AGAGGRNTLSGGQALIARLATILVREGGTFRTDLPVTGLVSDDAGRVVGVTASSSEGPVEFGARRGAGP